MIVTSSSVNLIDLLDNVSKQKIFSCFSMLVLFWQWVSAPLYMHFRRLRILFRCSLSIGDVCGGCVSLIGSNLPTSSMSMFCLSWPLLASRDL